MNNKKVAHLTSVHPRYDTRIFIKMCSSLAKLGYATSLIVADGKGNELKNHVSIFDVGKPTGRLNRVLKTTKNVYKKALNLNADLYHIHDPELIPVGLKLKKKGKHVIFDAHEDLPKQLLSKPYLKGYQQKILSFIALKYEEWTCKKFDAIITATPYIRDKFFKINPNSVDINNYPILEELDNTGLSWEEKDMAVCYVGGLSEVRGIREIVVATSLTTKKANLYLAGKFDSESYEKIVKSEPGWKDIKELGWLNRSEVANVYAQSRAGLVTLYPIINYLDSLPVKMFEYMAAGIPVIASDFPFWKEIIEKNECGICVDPKKPEDIAKAIDYLLENSDVAQKLGKNGRKAIEKKYNWSIEEQKLIQLYEKILI